jgi:glycosyltransferase involved in cell wall biosynthesis
MSALDIPSCPAILDSNVFGERKRRDTGEGEADGAGAMETAAHEVRVLHIAESALGGVGTYLNQIVPRLCRLRNSSGRRFVSRLLMPEPHSRMVADLNTDSVVLYPRHGRSVADLLRLGRLAMRHIRDFRPEIVHLHSTYAGAVIRPLVGLSRLLWGYPKFVIYSPHGWAFQISAAPLVQSLIVLIERALSLGTDRIILLSDAEMQECIGLGFRKSKLVRIYNGLAAVPKPAQTATWEDPRLKVFFTGRFDRQKGLDVLLEAAALAPGLITVRCAGASVVDEGASINVPANVELLGWLTEEEISGQLACADIVAVPSRWEGFGLVAIEAMRAGLPVVASRIGGLPEVIEEGVSGHLVPPDDPPALLAALLADGPEERKRKGEAGRRRFFDLFTSDASAVALGRVYAGLLDAGAPN